MPTHLQEHACPLSSWARPLVLALSFLSPVGVTAGTRALAQEEDSAPSRPIATAVSFSPLENLEELTTPYIVRSSARSITSSADYFRFVRAKEEHEQLFGAHSSVLLIWPDHYLSYEPLGETTRFDAHGLREHLRGWSRELLLDGSYSLTNYDEAVSTVRATTSLMGPAAFHINDLQPEAPSLIAVVGFDSARPRTLALKSLAGISCPTAMLTRVIPRDDLRAFVQFHESGHAFQFLSGAKKDAEHESPYERCIIEAEADVFASLWWLKTRNGDAAVPKYFSHLRRSSYFEHAAVGNHRVSVQYATHLTFLAALEIGEQLVADGTLSKMTSEEIYLKSRQIVRHTLPRERDILAMTTALHEALNEAWRLPFHIRVSQLTAMAHNGSLPAFMKSAIETYLESADYLTNPIHLRTDFPEFAHLPLNKQAEEIWLRELLEDLQHATAPMLVLERYTTELSSAALALWRLSASIPDPDGFTKFVMHEGAPNAFFVPTEKRSHYLEMTRKILIEKISAPPTAP